MEATAALPALRWSDSIRRGPGARGVAPSRSGVAVSAVGARGTDRSVSGWGACSRVMWPPLPRGPALPGRSARRRR